MKNKLESLEKFEVQAEQELREVMGGSLTDFIKNSIEYPIMALYAVMPIASLLKK